MATRETKKRTKPSRKARTKQVSEASESEHDATSPPRHKSQNPQSSTFTAELSSHSQTGMDIETDRPEASNDSPAPTQRRFVAPEQAFEDFYLKQATKEFANDLEKLRSASDFNERRSIPVLIESLRQGGACFTIAARARVGGAEMDEAGDGGRMRGS